MIVRIKHIVTLALKFQLVVLVLAALTILGAQSASRLYGGYHTAGKQASAEVKQMEIAPSPDEASEDTAKENSAVPDGEPMGWAQGPLVLQTGDSTRGDSNKKVVGCAGSPARARRSGSIASSSICTVSSSLGLQFTLVGAKPSGTG
jgi:hypothetical protein